MDINPVFDGGSHTANPLFAGTGGVELSHISAAETSPDDLTGRVSTTTPPAKVETEPKSSRLDRLKDLMRQGSAKALTRQRQTRELGRSKMELQ